MDDRDAKLLATLRDRREEVAGTLRRVMWARLGYALPLVASLVTGMASGSWYGPGVAAALSGMAAVAVEYSFLVTWLRYRAARTLEEFAERATAEEGGLGAPETAMRFEIFKRSLDQKGLCLAGAGMASASLAACVFWGRLSRTSFDLGSLLIAFVVGAIAVNCAAILVMMAVRVIRTGLRAQAEGVEG